LNFEDAEVVEEEVVVPETTQQMQFEEVGDKPDFNHES
jgi:hypothetical protein